MLLEGQLTKDAVIHPRGLCRLMLRGVSQQLEADKLAKEGCFWIHVPDDDSEVHESLYGPAQGYSGQYVDDLTGQVLKGNLVQEARLKELTYFAAIVVWKEVPRSRAREETGKPPITTRWVDVNKGDGEHPNYRSRLVARQLKAHDHSGRSTSHLPRRSKLPEQ